MSAESITSLRDAGVLVSFQQFVCFMYGAGGWRLDGTGPRADWRIAHPTDCVSCALASPLWRSQRKAG
jgi:hypothetical protein